MLSRIKSYEEKHHLESVIRLNLKNNSFNYSYANNNKKKIYLDNNSKQFPRLIKNNSSLSNKMNSSSNNAMKKKVNINNLKNELLNKRFKISETDIISAKGNKHLEDKQNIRIINNNIKNNKKI